MPLAYLSIRQALYLLTKMQPAYGSQRHSRHLLQPRHSVDSFLGHPQAKMTRLLKFAGNRTLPLDAFGCMIGRLRLKHPASRPFHVISFRKCMEHMSELFLGGACCDPMPDHSNYTTACPPLTATSRQVASYPGCLLGF